ncbi:Somatic embryogenesis receptor kinase 5 [Nymphon striatum]|nr:Somatic embryogenesis receptor kinase 5 [Nymphon striatum]
MRKKVTFFARMILPIENDDHMPLKAKHKPTKEEIKLVGAWIDAGHPFEGSIKEVGLAKGLFQSFFPKKQDNGHPDIIITEAAQDSILAIEKTGIHVDRISKSSNFLSISCINKHDFTDSDFESLLPIKIQIAKLDLGGTKITDAIFEKLAQLPNLTILKLDNTIISGENIELLSSLAHLKTLNLTSTNFEIPHLQKLSDFKSLQKVFVFQTKLDASGPKTLNDNKTTIDYGNYTLPQIAADSIIY